MNQLNLSAKLFLLLSMAVSCLTSVVVDDQSISFDRRNNNLDWPLPNVNDPGMLIIHGIHCFEKIQENDNRNESDSMSSMHLVHCRNAVTRILQLLENNPLYDVDDWICKSLGSDRKIRSLMYTLDYNRPSPQQRKRRSINNIIPLSKDQDIIFEQHQGYNFGKLLMKNFTDSDSLNHAEAKYLEKWISRSATAMGAVGLYCRVKGNIESIRITLFGQPDQNGPSPPNRQRRDLCADVRAPGSYSCHQQKMWGKCMEPWMQGYCNLTCGRCDRNL